VQSGNGWATCEQGHRHWGLFGAAGLLAYVAHPTDQALSLVLMQRRAQWSHEGGTWALPGGAMDSDESPAEAALREADEECMLDPKLVVPRGMYSAEHGGWAYHTVLAQAAEPLRVRADAYETDEAVWLPAGQVDALDLHPGFAASWPALREALLPLTVFVDGTGLAGTQAGADNPADAGRRLRGRLAELTRSGLTAVPDGVAGPALARWYPDYVLVLGGAAAAAAASSAAAAEAQAANQRPRFSWNEALTVRTAEIRIVPVAGGAQASDVISDLAAATLGHHLVVSADRAVRDRGIAAGAAATELSWLPGLPQPG
jgi:8-oxo-dGTP pyrophosphatase MutT (NUDIX family)